MLRYLIPFLSFSFLQASSPTIGAYYDYRAASRPPSGDRVVFSLNRVPAHLLTDLYFAFIPFNGSFQFSLPEGALSAFKTMHELKKRQNKNLNLFISLGGWGFNDKEEGKDTYLLFSRLFSTEASRAQFIQNVVAFTRTHQMDGIDLDWEYPGDLTRGGQEGDLDHFLLFLKEFKEKAPDLLLSAAFPATIPQGLGDSKTYYPWIKSCATYLDQIQLMTYDYHTPNDIPKITGVNAPLNRDSSLDSTLYIARSVKNYLDQGIPKEKIVLGIPLFGHSYAGVEGLSEQSYLPQKSFKRGSLPGISTRTPGQLSYYEISDLIAKKMFQYAPEPVTSTAIAYAPLKEEWISFDTPETIKLKADLARQMGLKGVFFWSIDQDEYQWNPIFPCINSAKESLVPSP